MKPVSGKRGWVLVRIKSSHHVYRKAGIPFTLVVPVHGNRDLRTGTQHHIMKDAGLTENDL